jgi:phage protein U
MWAVLGDITFEMVASPERYEAEGVYDFAQHKVVQAKPVLQWVSDALETLQFELKFHISYSNPATELAALKAAASQHLSMPFVYGNGYHRGYFVITKIGTAYETMSDLGDLVSIRVKVDLTEWVQDTSPTAVSPLQTGPAVQPSNIPVMSPQPGSNPIPVTGSQPGSIQAFQPATQPLPLSSDNAGLSTIVSTPPPAGPGPVPYDIVSTATITRAAP